MSSAVGVSTDDTGAIRVNAKFRTSVAPIYAVGDVIERVALTPVAIAEGELVAHDLFGEGRKPLDYEFIPSAVFSNPPIGTVGLTSDEACEEFGNIDVYRSVFTPMKFTMTGSGEKALLKVVVVRETGRVVGIHVVSPDAGEIAQGFAVALRCGVTKAELDRTIGIHPTIAEELVTMRERSEALDPRPGPNVEVEHLEPPKRKRIVHHRWEDEATRG
jgi:glutathione reductase (NADPH)